MDAPGEDHHAGQPCGYVEFAPIALAVDRTKHETFVAEFSLAAETDLADRLTLRSGIGFQSCLKDDFAETFACRKASYSISVGIGYRAEIRSGAETPSQVSLGTSFGF